MSFVEVMVPLGNSNGAVTQYAWSRDKNGQNIVLSDEKYFIFDML